MAVQSKQLTPMGYALAGALGGCFSNAYVQPVTITVGPYTEMSALNPQRGLPPRHVSCRVLLPTFSLISGPV